MNAIGEITIYTPSGQPLITTTLHDDSRYTNAINEPERVVLRFDRVEPVVIPYGAYIVYQARVWRLYSKYTPEMEDALARYEATFYQPSALLSEVAMLYTKAGRIEGAFDLTDSIEAHARVLQDNLNRRYPIGVQIGEDNSSLSQWQVVIQGNVEATHKHISYQSMSTLEAIGKIVEVWKCSWWGVGATIYIGSRADTNGVIDIRLGEIAQRLNPEDTASKHIGRLYAFGSTRNIPTSYRAERLCLPSSTPYIVGDETGGREHVEIFEDIYPRYVGRISSVGKEGDDGDEIYTISDNELTITQDKLLSGQSLTLSFASGALRGMDFEAQITQGKGYRIVPNETYGTRLPAGHITPSVGDEYIPHGFDISLVGESYIPRAEQELLQKATQWLEANEHYDGNIEIIADPVYIGRNDINIALGVRARITIDNATGANILATISRIEYPLSSPYEQTITASQGRATRTGVLGRLLEESERQRYNIERLTESIRERQRTSQLYIEYSQDGVNGWHLVANDSDRYIRQRVGANGIWSSPLQIRGEDVVQVQVWSESGTQFINGAVDTTLVAFVYRGSKEIGDTLPTTAYRWTRQSANTDTDAIWNALNSSMGRTLRLTPEDVDRSAHFTVIVTTE